MSNISSEVYKASRDGKALTVYALLCHKEKNEVGTILSTSTEEEGQITTPFLIAARNGHSLVIKILLTYFDIDVEQRGTVKFDGYIIEGATALWCASGAGHFEVVTLLLGDGANVNNPTFSNSTPLRAACFDGRLDIVEFLINNGADVAIPNKFNNTCLMIACYKGHLNVVSHLLKAGANPDTKAHCGATALHFSAERGHYEIVVELVKYGASMLANDQGLTPLHIAAECSNGRIVEFFVSQSTCTKKDRVEALELLGASYANDKDSYDIQKCYRYFWLAMKERHSEPILLKDIQPQVEAYENRLECTNVEQLENLEDEHDALHIEALIVRERILGENNIEIPHPIIYRGAVFADTARFDRCTSLWMRALKLRQKNRRSVSKDLLRFAQVFSQMIHVAVDVDFALAEEVFASNIRELESDLRLMHVASTDDDREVAKELLELNTHTALYLLVILLNIKKAKPEEFRLCKLAYKFCKLDIHLDSKEGATSLHLACDSATAVDDFHVNEIVQFPNYTLVNTLLQCGADPNVLDANGNTPLHIIVKYTRPVSDFLTLHNIIVLLLGGGAHHDMVNKKKETPSDCAASGVADIILKGRQKDNLKCIAAKAIKKYDLRYKGQVPVTLEDFIEVH